MQSAYTDLHHFVFLKVEMLTLHLEERFFIAHLVLIFVIMENKMLTLLKSFKIVLWFLDHNWLWSWFMVYLGSALRDYPWKTQGMI